eukprot:3516-Eustigmatos_ZCMA.PRE.1
MLPRRMTGDSPVGAAAGAVTTGVRRLTRHIYNNRTYLGGELLAADVEACKALDSHLRIRALG